MPEPTEQLAEAVDLLRELVAETKEGKTAVEAETAAREAALAEERLARTESTRRTRRLIWLVAGVLLVVTGIGSLLGYERVTRNETTCAEKLQRADVADQRVLIAVNHLAGTEYVRMPDAEREQMTADLERQLDQLPPPC